MANLNFLKFLAVFNIAPSGGSVMDDSHSNSFKFPKSVFFSTFFISSLSIHSSYSGSIIEQKFNDLAVALSKYLVIPLESMWILNPFRLLNAFAIAFNSVSRYMCS